MLSLYQSLEQRRVELCPIRWHFHTIGQGFSNDCLVIGKMWWTELLPSQVVDIRP